LPNKINLWTDQEIQNRNFFPEGFPLNKKIRHGTSEATLTPVNVQIQSNTSTKKDLAEKNERHDRSTLDPNRTITNDKSFTSVSTDKPYRRTDTFSDKVA